MINIKQYKKFLNNNVYIYNKIPIPFYDKAMYYWYSYYMKHINNIKILPNECNDYIIQCLLQKTSHTLFTFLCQVTNFEDYRISKFMGHELNENVWKSVSSTFDINIIWINYNKNSSINAIYGNDNSDVWCIYTNTDSFRYTDRLEKRLPYRITKFHNLPNKIYDCEYIIQINEHINTSPLKIIRNITKSSVVDGASFMDFLGIDIDNFPMTIKDFFYTLLTNIDNHADYIVFIYKQFYYIFGNEGIENSAIFEISDNGIIKTSQLTFSDVLNTCIMGNGKDIFSESIMIQ